MVILNEIELNTFHQNSFIRMKSKRVVKLMLKKICLSDNLVDLFTKSLSNSTFKKLICKIGNASTQEY